MIESDAKPQPLRTFDKSRARALYARAALSIGVFLGLLLLTSMFSDSITNAVLVNVILSVLALSLLSSAYYLTRAIRIARREVIRSRDRL